MTITENATEYQQLFKKLLQAIEKGPDKSVQECLNNIVTKMKDLAKTHKWFFLTEYEEEYILEKFSRVCFTETKRLENAAKLDKALAKATERGDNVTVARILRMSGETLSYKDQNDDRHYCLQNTFQAAMKTGNVTVLKSLDDTIGLMSLEGSKIDPLGIIMACIQEKNFVLLKFWLDYERNQDRSTKSVLEKKGYALLRDIAVQENVAQKNKVEVTAFLIEYLWPKGIKEVPDVIKKDQIFSAAFKWLHEKNVLAATLVRLKAFNVEDKNVPQDVVVKTSEFLLPSQMSSQMVKDAMRAPGMDSKEQSEYNAMRQLFSMLKPAGKYDEKHFNTLLKNVNVNVKGLDGSTLLSTACRNKKIPNTCIVALLKQGADPSTEELNPQTKKPTTCWDYVKDRADIQRLFERAQKERAPTQKVYQPSGTVVSTPSRTKSPAPSGTRVTQPVPSSPRAKSPAPNPPKWK